jgi:tRNA modification GTPase
LQATSFSPESMTVYAPASGVGRAAITVVRLSGPASDAALRTLCGADLPADRVAALKTLRDPRNGDPLDRALVIRFAAPRSFTGESMVELHITGGRAVLNAVLGALATIPSLRPAEAGEFAWRAFENGKLDLSQVEGLADLVDAQTDAQRRQALRIAGGALTRQTSSIRSLLMRAMALVEAQIDFSDQEDVDTVGLADARRFAGQAAELIRQTLANAHSGEALRDGFVVVIAGPPNVGKSTLMNTLARRDVSIVSTIPGTTRDVIEVHLDLRGYPVTLVDTAGMREANDPIEKEGISRALQRVDAADLTLWLIDKGEDVVTARRNMPSSRENSPRLVVRTKIDVNGNAPEQPVDSMGKEAAQLSISAKTGAGISELLDAVANHAEQQLAGQGPALITQERHRLAFEEALKQIEANFTRPDDAPEIIAEDLRRAARALERIAGRIDVEEVLGEIFSRLCIGK